MSNILRHLTPTSNADLFVDQQGQLVHRRLGQLGGNARYPLRMPDGKQLKVFYNAPTVNVKLVQLDGPSADDSNIGQTIKRFVDFTNEIAGYIRPVQLGVQLFEFLIGLYEDTANPFASISEQLQQLMKEVGANDYLAIIREMDLMRGNADAAVKLLETQALRDLSGTLGTNENQQFNGHVFQLDDDINALLQANSGFFRRTYYEDLIRGDGKWQSVIPDRPADQNGTTFEYRLAMPTLMYLISVRLICMKFQHPDFMSSGLYSSQIMDWWRSVEGLSETMTYYVRTTPITPIEVQAARRQSIGGQEVGSYYDWETHCPADVVQVGAIDITTGYGFIDWDYTPQFDEWYLGQGSLHGRNAGHWPPSFGPKWYEPPPGATDLPPMNDDTIQRYYTQTQLDAQKTARSVSDQIGAIAVKVFAWNLLDFALPNAPIP